MEDNIFRYKKANFHKLAAFGFKRSGDSFTYNKTLSESGFILTVSVTSRGEVYSEITDPAANEPYALHLVDGAAGSFVGGVRSQYRETMEEIAEQCFEPDVFKSAQTKELIAYVSNSYGDELEFLWKKFPYNAVWRRKDTKKWYGALLTISKRKLGINADDMAEIIDLRIKPEELDPLVDNKLYFPGYHMNKKHWYTIILDGSVPTEEICGRIDESYRLAAKR